MITLNSGQHMIEARRRSENAYRDMEAVTAHMRKVQLRTDFEITTTNKIERKMKQQIFEIKKKEYADQLMQRRRRLAELFNSEMNGWKLEVMARVETVVDRKKRIMNKAYALRDAREKARQDYVQRRLNDQWRDSCDDARRLDSKAMTMFMNEERLRQIGEKIEKKKMLSQQENNFLNEWNRQMDELEKRDREKEDNRRRVNKETSLAIQKQMEENQRVKEAFYHTLRCEEDAELERLRKDIEAEERLQRLRIQEAHARGGDVMKFNLEYQKMREEEKAIEKEHDKILLDYALRKEREAIAAEELKKNADRQAALQYRKYLEEQMVKEAEDTAFVDEIRKREEEKVWKARDEALQAREDARNRLMKIVDEGRQDQIRLKREELERERIADQQFVQKFMDDAEDAAKKEKEDELKRRRNNIENNHYLLDQIDSRRMKEELLKQEEYLADKQMKYREKLHQERLSEQAGNVRMSFPLKKNQWYS